MNHSIDISEASSMQSKMNFSQGVVGSNAKPKVIVDKDMVGTKIKGVYTSIKDAI